MKDEVKPIVNQKGLELATDVLKQLRFYNVSCGEYIGDTNELTALMKTHGQESAQKHIETLKHCPVCAKGALCLAYIEKYNNVILDDVQDIANYGLEEFLQEFFGEDELDLIESAFEGWAHYRTGLRLGDFRDIEPKERLRLIMENIVENGGKFEPYLYYDTAMEFMKSQGGLDVS